MKLCPSTSASTLSHLPGALCASLGAYSVVYILYLIHVLKTSKCPHPPPSFASRVAREGPAGQCSLADITDVALSPLAPAGASPSPAPFRRPQRFLSLRELAERTYHHPSYTHRPAHSVLGCTFAPSCPRNRSRSCDRHPPRGKWSLPWLPGDSTFSRQHVSTASTNDQETYLNQRVEFLRHFVCRFLRVGLLGNFIALLRGLGPFSPIHHHHGCLVLPLKRLKDLALQVLVERSEARKEVAALLSLFISWACFELNSSLVVVWFCRCQT